MQTLAVVILLDEPFEVARKVLQVCIGCVIDWWLQKSQKIATNLSRGQTPKRVAGIVPEG